LKGQDSAIHCGTNRIERVLNFGADKGIMGITAHQEMSASAPGRAYGSM
jgi:hypothetical protein